MTITIDLPPEKLSRLAEIAKERGVSTEDLARSELEEFLARQSEFVTAASYVLAKNAELYRRLAK